MDTPEFFITGGTLPHDALCYVERRADRDLWSALQRGEFCYLLTARQMGKSSLMVRTAVRLRESGASAAILDLSALGLNLTPVQWYRGMLLLIGQQLGLEEEMDRRWSELHECGPVQRLMQTLRDVVLPAREGRIVVFVDEIDIVRSLPFGADEFFAAIRECYNRRRQDRKLERLTFCLIGVATPSDLIRDPRCTPFNIGRRIELDDFTEAEATPLTAGLSLNGVPSQREARRILSRILYWTGGHPYLTQRLCQAVSAPNPQSAIRSPKSPDEVCRDLFLTPRARERDDNLIFVRERLIRSQEPGTPSEETVALLHLYDRVRRGQRVPDTEADPHVALLRLSGIVRSQRGLLRVRNRIYARVFDSAWARDRMPHAELRRQREAYRRGLLRTAAVSGGILAVVSGLAGYAFYSRSEAQRLERAAGKMAGERQAALNEANLLLAQGRVQAAWEAVETGNYARACALLDEQVPGPGGPDLRSWAWWHLRSRCGIDLTSALTREGTGTIHALAFLQDGQSLAVADGATVRGYGPGNGVETFGGSGSQGGVAFAPESGYLARAVGRTEGSSRSESWSLELLPLRPGPPTGGAAVLASVLQERGWAAAFSPRGDGLALLTGRAGQGTPLLWRVDGKRAAPVELPSHPTRTLAFSPDGATLALGGEDGEIRLVDTTAGRALGGRRLRVPGGAVTALCFLPDRRLAAGAADGRGVLLDPESGKKVDLPQAPAGPRGRLDGLRVSPDGALLIGRVTPLGPGRGKGLLRAWRLPEAAELPHLPTGTGTITATDFSPHGLLAAGSLDRRVRLWDLGEPSIPVYRTPGGQPVYALAFSPDGTRLTLQIDREAISLDLARAQPVGRVRLMAYDEQPPDLLHERAVYSADLRCARPSGVDLYLERHHSPVSPAPSAAARDLRLRHPAPISAVAFNPAGNRLITGTSDGRIQVWDASSGQSLGSSPPQSWHAARIKVAQDGRSAAILGDDGYLRHFDLTAGRMHGRPLGRPAWLAFGIAPDGSHIVAGSSDGLIVWDTATGQVRAIEGVVGAAGDLCISPDGRTLALTGGADGVQIWDVATARRIGALPGSSPGGTLSVAFSPDGRTLAAGGRDGSIRLWQAPRSGLELMTLLARRQAGPAATAGSIPAPADRQR